MEDDEFLNHVRASRFLHVALITKNEVISAAVRRALPTADLPKRLSEAPDYSREPHQP